MRLIALVLASCAGLNGCFAYVPTTGLPAPASRVRVQLAAPTDFRLLDFTANEVLMVDGEMVRADSQVVVLSAMELRGRSGYEFIGRGESITIPRERITTIQRQKLSPVRTVLLGGVVAAVAALAGRLVAVAGESGGEGGRPTPPEN